MVIRYQQIFDKHGIELTGLETHRYRKWLYEFGYNPEDYKKYLQDILEKRGVKLSGNESLKRIIEIAKDFVKEAKEKNKAKKEKFIKNIGAELTKLESKGYINKTIKSGYFAEDHKKHLEYKLNGVGIVLSGNESFDEIKRIAREYVKYNRSLKRIIKKKREKILENFDIERTGIEDSSFYDKIFNPSFSPEVQKNHLISRLAILGVQLSGDESFNELIKIAEKFRKDFVKSQIYKVKINNKLRKKLINYGVTLSGKEDLEYLLELYNNEINKIPQFIIDKDPILPSSILNIERYLTHQLWFFQQIHERQLRERRPRINLAGYTALPTMISPTTNRLIRQRTYHMLDFRDFIEYATSDLVGQFNISDIPENHILFYDGLPNTYNEPLFDYGFGGGFSIVGVAMTKINVNQTDFLGICCQVRFHLSDLEDVPDEVIINEDFAGGYLAYEHRFPFCFIHMVLSAGKSNELFEWSRSEVFPPIVMNENTYGVKPKGNKYKADLNLETIPKIFGIQSIFHTTRYATEQKIIDESIFEAIRLMIHLPAYFKFMFDLIVDEKRPVRIQKNGATNKNKRKETNNKEIKFKIVKSIRVSYQAEKEARSKLIVPKRSWSPPSYKFVVRGHWRKLRYSYSKGHDAEGNIIYGRTWIKEYVKGKDGFKFKTETANPNITVKLKQPLSYAIDVLKSHDQAIIFEHEQQLLEPEQTQSEKIVKAISVQEEQVQKPSAEWRYQERIKLTSGLRWIILKRDDFKCCVCGRGADDGIKLHIDHIKPIDHWGRTEEKNLRTLCGDCNLGKGSSI